MTPYKFPYLLLVGALIVVFIGCQTNRSKKIEESSDIIEKARETSQPDAFNLIQFVTSHSRERTEDSIAFEYAQKDSIPLEFRKHFIAGQTFGPEYDYILPLENWPCYFWNDYLFLDSLFYFSFIHQDEFCCKTLYGMLVDVESQKTTDLSRLALEGGDGGWVESDYGKWFGKDSLYVVQPEYYDALDPDSLGFTEVKYDTTWVAVIITRQGKFQTLVLDSTTSFTLEKFDY